MATPTRNSKRSSSPSSAAAAVSANRSAKVRCVVPAPIMQDRLEELIVVVGARRHDESDQRALEVMDSLVKFFEQNQKLLDKLLKESPLVRCTTGDRYEILYEKYPKQFDNMLKENSSDPVLLGNCAGNKCARVIISTYGKAKFGEDTRYEQNYVFGTFALFLSFGVNYAQPIHIDLRLPNVQFVLTMTNMTPLTEVNTLRQDKEGKGSRSVDGLFAHWKEISGGNETPPVVSEHVRNSDDISGLVQSYGHLLPPVERFRMRGPLTAGESIDHEAGTAVIIPGSLPHRAPSSSKFRAVIFGTARPPDCGIEYDHNPQYTAPGLVIDILQELWKKPGIDFPERVFLLQMLSYQLLKFSEDESHNEDLSNHYDEDTDIEKFLAKVQCIHKRAGEGGEGMNGKDEKKIKTLIETAAKIAPREFRFSVSVTDSDQSDSDT